MHTVRMYIVQGTERTENKIKLSSVRLHNDVTKSEQLMILLGTSVKNILTF